MKITLKDVEVFENALMKLKRQYGRTVFIEAGLQLAKEWRQRYESKR